ncbi:MAG: DNA-processing protein DprA [Patescibacteria group bacterium]
MSRVMRDFFDVDDETIVSLAGVEEIGPIYWNKIKKSFGSLSEFIKTPHHQLHQLLPDKQVGALTDRQKARPLPKSIKLLTLSSPDYPELLKQMPDPPLWLFVVGNVGLLNSPTISIVGSRKHTAYAKEAINKLVTASVAKELTIVSGLAYGIDKLAHQKSIDSGGQTIAVLAGGLDKIYPLGHRHIAKQIVQLGGTVISEYPPGSPAYAYRFPIRNRIIAGLSRATIVVEAAIKSGSMTTARSAIDYNRELFAVPGDVTKLSSEGCNYLISQGATPLIDPIQLSDFYNISVEDEALLDQTGNPPVDLHSPVAFSDNALELLADGSGLSIDQLAEKSGLSVDALLRQLTMLELSGKIYQERPGYFKTK